MSVIIELVKLAFVDSSNSQLSLHGRDERRSLEKSASESFESTGELCFTTGKSIVQTDNADVLLSCTLLGLDEARCAINTDDQTSCDLGIECSAVTGLLNSDGSISPDILT